MARYLVIAASSDIGQVVTDLLQKKGHYVFTTSRNKNKITPDAILEADDFEAVLEVFKKAGKIDGVVNCSGSLLLKNAHNTSKKEYEETIKSSLTTAFATVRAAGQIMTGGGSVVLIASAAAITGIPNHEAIAAAKAGVIGLAQAAAATYAQHNLRFNVVAPGMTDTSLTKSITNNEVLLNASKAMHALGRIGTPLDIAKAVFFFLDPQNNWITGQTLAVDGGLSKIRPKVKI